MSFIRYFDWFIIFAILPIVAAGLLTMKSLGAESDYFFSRQIIWLAVGFILFFLCGMIDWRFFKNSSAILFIYLVGLLSLIILIAVGIPIRGSTSWFSFSKTTIEPVEPMKLILILLLSKYFARRHIEIANIKHIIISGIYAAIPALLVFIQPDFGSALILILIWFGMIMVSGVKKQHLFLIILIGLTIFLISWFFIFQPYQKLRITTFLNPFKDPQGAGYNILQSQIAIGSGKIFGRGVGYGTQSRLEFLPEHQTDFIFAAFAEEWGFLGVISLFLFLGLLIWRILKNGIDIKTNFEKFFALGLAILIGGQAIIHIGMNIGLLPITGLTMPFMSYGGSSLITFFIGFGILQGLRRYALKTYSEEYNTLAYV